MTDKEKKYLSDILNSINHIISFTDGINTFDLYQKNFLVKSAVERHLGIIGEAVNKFLKESSGNYLASSTEIISLRNRLIHSYDNVDDRIIWTIVRKHLVPLREEVNQKIN
jgi:uncharacterized protein with HEPN domain